MGNIRSLVKVRNAWFLLLLIRGLKYNYEELMKISDGVLKVELENGLTVLLKATHTTPVVAIYTYVKAGYFDETDDIVGISHLIEHMFFKSTLKRGAGALAKETKALGGYLNASTIYDHTLYYTVLPSENLAAGLELQSDALIYSAFKPDELRSETEVVIQEAKRKLDMPSSVAREKLLELAFTEHRMRRWRIGSEEGLRKFTRDDYLNFHKKYYRPQNIILTLVGDFEPEKAIAEIKNLYGDMAPQNFTKSEAPTEPRQTEFRNKTITGNIQQCYLVTGFHVPNVHHEDSYALEIVSHILSGGRSSRFYQNIKEQGLVQTINSYNYTLNQLGIFLIEATTQPEKLRQAEVAVFEQIKQLIENGLEQDELLRARNQLEAMYVFSMESISGVASVLSSYEAQGDYREVENYLEKLFQVTAEDVIRVAKKYLTQTNCSLLEYVPTNAGLSQLNKHDLEIIKPNSIPKGDTNKSISRDLFQIKNNSASNKPTAIHQLSSGAKLIIKESHELPIVCSGIFTMGGRNCETAQIAGISDIMTRTAIKGTKTRTALEIASQIEDLGASIDYNNSPDYLSCEMNVLSNRWDKAWALQTDLLCNPIFPESELEKEKLNNIERIKKLKDDTFRYPLQLFYAALFQSHPYGLPVLGTADSISPLTSEGLKNWHSNFFRPDGLLFVAVGDLEMQKYIDDAETLIEKLSKSEKTNFNHKPVSPIQTSTQFIETQKKEQTALILGFDGPDFNDQDYYPLKVMQNIVSGLGGRFFEELRSKQSLAYTVSTFTISRMLGGAILSYIATSPDKESVARNGLINEYKKMTQEPVSKKELDDAIKYTVGTYHISLETLRAQMSVFAHYQLLGKGLEGIDDFPQKIQKVTQDDIWAACKKYFDMEKLVEVMVRGEKR